MKPNQWFQIGNPNIEPHAFLLFQQQRYGQQLGNWKRMEDELHWLY